MEVDVGGTALTYLCLALSFLYASTEPEVVSSDLRPPVLLGELDLIAPEGSLVRGREVSVRLTIDASGLVSELYSPDLLSEQLEWLLLRLIELKFQPALHNGQPLAVQVPLTLSVQPQPVPVAHVHWRVFEEGTSRALPGISIRVLAAGEELTQVVTDISGKAVAEIGVFNDLEVVAEGDGFLALMSQFEASAGSSLTFDILLMPESAFGGYRQVVRGKRERTGSRLVLTQKEMTHVAGSLNDPFRTIQTLPGVSSISSYFPLPVVRGTGPNHSSIWIDGFVAPMVFHFLAGPSVIYPELLQDLSYESGDAGADYGGQIGGVIAARTGFDLSSELDVVESNLNLAQAGILGRRQSAEDVWIASGRVGYPGYLLRLGGADLDLTYWDYHGQWSRTEKSKKQRLALHGAGDAFRTPTSIVPLRLQFHRLLYEYRSSGLRVGTMTELSMTTLPDQPEELRSVP